MNNSPLAESLVRLPQAWTRHWLPSATPTQWRKFLGELSAARQTSPGTQGVRLTLRGNDVLSREMLRSATRENQNNGNTVN